MKYILTLACAVLTACGQSTNTNNLPWPPKFDHTEEATPYTFDTMTSRGMNYKTIWKDCGTNICELNLVTNVVTQWLPIEREEGQRGARVKQIGILVTNQVLTVIAYDKTNEVILKVLGREEWPSQKRVIVVPNMAGAPVLTKGH